MKVKTFTLVKASSVISQSRLVWQVEYTSIANNFICSGAVVMQKNGKSERKKKLCEYLVVLTDE